MLGVMPFPLRKRTMRNTLSITAVILLLSMTMPVLAAPAGTDTDGDSIFDTQEDSNLNGIVDAGETDPYNADTDRGGESDGSEIRAKRNPFDQTDDMTFDADGDGWVNGTELLNSTDPKNADTDGDGMNDSIDPFPNDAKYASDSNDNGLPDDWERAMTLDQNPIPQSKADDPDADGLTNAEELARGTNPTMTDTDRDGISDNDEIDHGSNPRENPCLEYRETPLRFPDTVGHWAEGYVSSLKNTSILPAKIPLVRGYSQNKTSSRAIFAPDQAVTRFEFLKMALLSACLQPRTPAADIHAFSDVPLAPLVDEHPDLALKRKIIYTAQAMEVVTGYEDGTFRPDAPVSRAEAIKMLLKLLPAMPDSDLGSHYFSDVSPTDWFAPYVEKATDREIMRGYGDSIFGPHQSITRAETAKIIEIGMKQNPWINGYVLP